MTVAAVLERDGHFMLVEELIDGRRVLNQPAGHWERGESLVQACTRETLEECGVAFTPTALVGIYRWAFTRDGNEITFLRFTFAGDVGERNPARALDRDIVATHWLTHAALSARSAEHRSPLVMRSVDDFIAGKRYSLDVLAHLD